MLIEALIAILLFSLGILGLIGLQARATQFSVDAEDRNRAALLANDVASIMWLKKSITLSETEKDGWEARLAAVDTGGLPGGEGLIEPVDGTTNAADITITWRQPSRDASAQASTYTTRVTLPLASP
ncbi:fimbrial assembly protein [Variovorax sp.]|uniref:type IV pilus modification PilV family protein n=1 Tax=Variovorax sp. TaxID=1871043 RepID=UPI002D769F99|nr:fimbrial assembly protein [Variovorax sp.]